MSGEITDPRGKSVEAGCQTGIELLHNPVLNKGTAFTDEERSGMVDKQQTRGTVVSISNAEN